MRVTVCELPHETGCARRRVGGACASTPRRTRRELVLLPEFAMVEPVWEAERFDAERWSAVEALSAEHGSVAFPTCAPSTWWARGR